MIHHRQSELSRRLSASGMSDNTATLPEYRAQLAALIEARRSPSARFRRWLASALDTLSRKVMT